MHRRPVVHQIARPAVAVLVAVGLVLAASSPPPQHGGAHATTAKRPSTDFNARDVSANLPAGCSQDLAIATQVDCTYTYTGSSVVFAVPGGVHTLSTSLAGAQGGSNGDSSGGAGGSVAGTLSVTPGDDLVLRVGGAGGVSSAGYPDGGTSNSSNLDGCGGGGSSSIIENGTGNKLVSAGGGGGCGGETYDGSHGTGGAGGNDAFGTAGGGSTGGHGGLTTCGAGGDPGGAASFYGPGGHGDGGDYYVFSDARCETGSRSGSDGSGTVGGNGASGYDYFINADGGGSGGGGGGGWFGGGGGGGGEYAGGGGGGGGGSNGWDTNLFSYTSSHQATQGGNGSIYLTYSQLPTTTSVYALYNPVNYGGPQTLFASVQPAGVDPTSTVAFTENGNPIACDQGPATVVAGVAQCSFTETGAIGVADIQAAYSGDAGDEASTGSTSYTVRAVPTSTSIGNITAGLNALSVPVTVTPGAAYSAIDGTVSVTTTPASGGCADLGVPTEPAGSATTVTCLLQNLASGTQYTVHASYSGSTYTAASTATDASATTGKETSAASITVAPSSGTYGDTVTLTGTVTENGSTPAAGTMTVYTAPGAVAAGTPPSASWTLVCQKAVTTIGASPGIRCTGITPPGGTTHYVAYYAGDAQTSAATSASVTYTATAASTVTALTIAGATNTNGSYGAIVGAPVTLGAATTFSTPSLLGQPAPAADEQIKDGATVICASAPCTLTTLAPGVHHLTATYAGTSAALTSTSSTATLTIRVASATLALVVPASAQPAGSPITLTVTLSTAAANAGHGTVSFYDAADPTHALCSHALPASRVTTCVTTPAPGVTVGYQAVYTGDVVTGTVTSPVTDYTGAPAATTTAVTASPAGGTAYGASVTLIATVTSAVTTPRAIPNGTVSFRSGATTYCTDVSVVAGSDAGVATARCTTSALHAGSHTVTATYAGIAGTAGSSGSGTVDVSGAVTTTSVSAVDMSSGVTVSVNVAASGVVPVGSVSVHAGTADGAQLCSVAALDQSGAGSCTFALPAAGTYTYVAVFAPSTADFLASDGSVEDTVGAADEPCTDGFGALWTNASANHTLTEDGGVVGSLVLKTGKLGTCNQARTLAFTATATLFGSSLTGSGLHGVASQSGGLCLTPGGSLALPAAYHAGALTITAPICFELAADGSLGRLDDGTLAAAPDTHTPFFTVPGVGTVGLTVSAGHDDAGVATLTLATTVSGAGPSATLSATVAADGSVSGSLSTSGITLFGQPIDLQGSFTRSADGTLDANVTAAIAAPFTLLPGVRLHDLTMTLGTDGLAVAGQADLGASDQPVTVSVDGAISSLSDWTLTVSSTGASWTPVSGLMLNPDFTGTVTDTAGSYDYDITASGATGTPLATWTPGSGISISVGSVELSNSATACGTGDPVLSVSGSVSAGPVTAALAGCVDLATRAYQLTATSDSVPITAGLSLTGFSASIDGTGEHTTFTGSATGSLDVGGKTLTVPFKVVVSSDGGVVIGAGVDLTPLGLPVTQGYVAYASKAEDAFDTGDDQLAGGSVIPLPSGLSGRGVITLPSAVAATLAQAGWTVPNDLAVAFEASFSPTEGAKFSGELTSPSSMPLVTLPGGSTLDSASLDYEDGALTITAAASIAQSGAPAAATLTVTVSRDGGFSGTAGISGLQILGKTVDLAGSISKPAGGAITAQITAMIPGPIAVGSEVELTGIAISLGTSGLVLHAEATIAGAAPLTVDGTFNSLTDWSLSVSGRSGTWTPTNGVTFDAVLNGSLVHHGSSTTIDLTASGPDGAALFTISPSPAASVSVTSIQFGNDTAPADCSAAAGDFYLSVMGALTFDLGTASGTVAAAGCFDFTHPAFHLTATVPGLSVTLLGGAVHIDEVSVGIGHTAAGFTVEASARLTVTMPFGGQVAITASLQYSGDAFAVGASVDLSAYLGAKAASAYLYYASAPITVTVADPAIGTVMLAPGVTVALGVELTADQTHLLSNIGLSASSGVKLAAIGTIDFVHKIVTLDIRLDLGVDGQTIFGDANDPNNPYLQFNNGALELTISPTLFTLGIRATATLHLPPVTQGSAPSSVVLTGMIAISDDAITVSLTATGWTDAFGQQGLNLDVLAIQGGIDFEGIPSLGFVAQVSRLPDSLASAIGYTNGAPITIAINLSADQLLLDLSIGTQDSGVTALAPLTLFGAPDLIKVDFAKLYISPDGAKIGTQVFSAGFELALQATVDGVALDIDAKVDPVNLSLYFKAMIGQITIGAMTFGPTTVLLDASDHTFDFELSGALSLGPGTLYVGPDLRFTGSASGNVDVKIGTSGLSVHGNFDFSVAASDWLPQSACYYWGFIPYPCNYAWVSSNPVSVHLDNLGFSVNSSGVTFDIPNTSSSITLPFPGGASSDASPNAATPNVVAPRVAGGTPATLARNAPGAPASATGALPAAAKGHIVTGPIVSGASHPPVARGTWEPTGSLLHGRSYPATASLPGGKVLVAGGVSSGSVLDTAEVYDEHTGTWTATGPMVQGVITATATTLPDGRVLLAGGATASGPVRTAQLFDPATNRWTAAAPMTLARQGATATLLANGTVLVSGGRTSGGATTAAAELFDPAAGAWTPAAAMAGPRAFASAVRLGDGSVLVAGGVSSHVLASAELYEPKSGRWTAVGSMAHARFGATLLLLRSGSALITGGSSHGELYRPASRRWSAGGQQSAPLTFAAAVLLAGGRVLTVGGEAAGKVYATAQVYSATTNRWSAAADVPGARSAAAALTLPDGNVLVVGGTSSGNPIVAGRTGAEVFVLPGGPHAANGDNGANGANVNGNGDTGLSTTGLPAAPPTWIPIGALLIVLGGLALYAGRRRRS